MLRYCECHGIRKSMIALKRSGLADSIEQYRFDNFRTDEPFQKAMYDKCKGFIAQKDSRFLYIGGQPGCGKTHICTAICGDYIKRGAQTIYTTHQMLLQELKRNAVDDEYNEVLDKYGTVPVLYIDDFFKPIYEVNRRTGERKRMPPSAADVKHTFEVINMRLVKNLITIMTSELYLDEIMDIDEALGSRIKQKCGAAYVVDIAYKGERNYRTRHKKGELHDGQLRLRRTGGMPVLPQGGR